MLCGLLHGLLQRSGQLVGAGGRLAAAADALQPRDGVLCLHALYEAGDALGVAGAASDKLYMPDDMLRVQLNFSSYGTGSVSLV